MTEVRYEDRNGNEAMLQDFYKVVEQKGMTQDEVIKSVIDFTKTDGLDLDMKIAYKYLESIRKEVKAYFKIAGYLKELRIKQWKDNLNILI